MDREKKNKDVRRSIHSKSPPREDRQVAGVAPAGVNRRGRGIMNIEKMATHMEEVMSRHNQIHPEQIDSPKFQRA